MLTDAVFSRLPLYDRLGQPLVRKYAVNVAYRRLRIETPLHDAVRAILFSSDRIRSFANRLGNVPPQNLCCENIRGNLLLEQHDISKAMMHGRIATKAGAPAPGGLLDRAQRPLQIAQVVMPHAFERLRNDRLLLQSRLQDISGGLTDAYWAMREMTAGELSASLHALADFASETSPARVLEAA